MKNFLEKNFAKIMSTMILVAMFGYTMFVFNNVHKELLRIDRNVQELVSDVYKRKESATDLFMDQTYNYENY
jgi:hypothetical protein